MSIDLAGIYAAVPTPLDAAGDVDEKGLRQIVRRLLAAHVHGLWVLGSGAEFVCLEPDQQSRIITIVTEEVKRRVPVIAGTGAASGAAACKAGLRAEQYGADAVFAMAPFYYACSALELERHFRSIADATSLPVVLYNNPWNTRTQIPIELIQKLSQNRRFIGLKDSSADWDYLTRILQSVPRDGSFRVMQGNELALGPAFLMGADGAVIALPIIAPKLCVRLFEAARHQDLPQVQALQADVTELFEIYVCSERSPDSAFLAGQKAAMELLGLCSRRIAAPFLEANHDEAHRIESILQKHSLLPVAEHSR